MASVFIKFPFLSLVSPLTLPLILEIVSIVSDYICSLEIYIFFVSTGEEELIGNSKKTHLHPTCS